MVINWIGNDTNFFLVHLVVEGLSKRLRGSPFLVSPILTCHLFTDLFGTKGQDRSLSLFSVRDGNSTKILLRGLAVTKLRVETRMVCSMIMMC